MQNHAFTLTLSRAPQTVYVPGGMVAPVRLVFAGDTGPSIAFEVDPAAATVARVFCFRLEGEDTPGDGWTYLGGFYHNAEMHGYYVYEQQAGRR